MVILQQPSPLALIGREVLGGRRDEGAAAILIAGCLSYGPAPLRQLVERLWHGDEGAVTTLPAALHATPPISTFPSQK